ncbi:hypothetical protein CLV37_103177 [Kineococcus rhizosphaerae]|uniref:Uncharacterized protein n=1 Tax=Kineococcus rhizosphaerae TaxID=559628 RepID=A0A2T0R6G1_9ACTN|nr:hypothetical protein CLV37_103177 [Kineococcus rhizosphaerae]
MYGLAHGESAPGGFVSRSVECADLLLHHHTALTPVSLRLFVVLPVLLHVKEFHHRHRPCVGDDVTWFLRSRPVPAELGTGVRHGTLDPVPGAVPTTGFPVRVRVVNWALSGPSDDRRPVPGSADLRDVHRPPKRFLAGRDRRDTHVLVDLAVRRT